MRLLGALLVAVILIAIVVYVISVIIARAAGIIEDSERKKKLKRFHDLFWR